MESTTNDIVSESTIEAAAATKKLIESFGSHNIHLITVSKPNDNCIVKTSIHFIAGLAPHLHEFAINIHGFSASFAGTGPHDLLDILRCAGVSKALVAEEDIFTEGAPALPMHLEREATAYGDYKSL